MSVHDTENEIIFEKYSHNPIINEGTFKVVDEYPIDLDLSQSSIKKVEMENGDELYLDTEGGFHEEPSNAIMSSISRQIATMAKWIKYDGPSNI